MITFTNGDTSPTVLSGNFFKTGNTGATTIVSFDDGADGQEITILFTDGNTTLKHTTGAGENLVLQGATNFVGTTNDVLKLTKSGTYWFETSRSVN